VVSDISCHLQTGLEEEWAKGSNGYFEICPNENKTTKKYANNLDNGNKHCILVNVDQLGRLYSLYSSFVLADSILFYE
jgi:hypothetical protein